MRRFIPLLFALLPATAISAESASPPSLAAADAQFDRGDTGAAIDAYVKLLFDPTLRRHLPDVDAARIRLRIDAMLADEAEPSLMRIELARLKREAGDPARRAIVDRLLARVNERAGHTQAAFDGYAKALAGPLSPEAAAMARLGRARLLLIAEPQKARAELAAVPQVSPDAAIETLRLQARLALNAGRPADAAGLLDRAMALALTAPTRSPDEFGRLSREASAVAAIRGDRASTVNLAGVAPRLVAPAATGITEGGGAGMPPCMMGGPQRDDFGLIEIRYAQAGAVSEIQPIYFTRPAAAAAFLTNARGWTTVEPLARRSRSRIVEVRCSDRGDSYADMTTISEQLYGWLDSLGVDLIETATAYSKTPPPLPPSAAMRSTISPRLIPVLIRALNSAETPELRRAYMDTIYDGIRGAGAPDFILATAEVARIERIEDKDERLKRIEALRARLRFMKEDAHDLASLRFTLSRLAYSVDQTRGAQMLNELLAQPDSAFSADDPLRIVALEMRAAIGIQMKDSAATQAARAALARPSAGCAYAQSATPSAALGGTITTDDYPAEAIVAGIAGIVTVDYRVEPDGRTSQPRIVYADPPFVFDDITRTAVGRFRFEPWKASDPNCVTRIQTIRWQFPGQRDAG